MKTKLEDFKNPRECSICKETTGTSVIGNQVRTLGIGDHDLVCPKCSNEWNTIRKMGQ